MSSEGEEERELLEKGKGRETGACVYSIGNGTACDANGAFHDEHGLAALFSGTATLYVLSPLLFQARINYLAASHSFNTLSGTIGIGYELGTDKPATGKPAGEGVGALKNEITGYTGVTRPQHPEERTGHFLGPRVPAEPSPLPRMDGHGAF